VQHCEDKNCNLWVDAINCQWLFWTLLQDRDNIKRSVCSHQESDKLRRQQLALWIDNKCQRLRVTSSMWEWRYPWNGLAAYRQARVEQETLPGVLWEGLKKVRREKGWLMVNSSPLQGSCRDNGGIHITRFIEAKGAAVTSSAVSTELLQTSGTVDHFQQCTISDIGWWDNTTFQITDTVTKIVCQQLLNIVYFDGKLPGVTLQHVLEIIN